MQKIIIAIVIIAAVIGGGYFYMQSQSSTATEEEKDITPTESVSTPTPEKVDNSKYKIEILNGSGIAGEAGKAKKLLEDDKFTVESTGNADSYDYEETVIKANNDVDEKWVDQLKETLGKNYKVDSSVDDQDEDAEVDVTVIVGKFDENGDDMTPEEEATATPAPTSSTSATSTPVPSTTVTPTVTLTPTPKP